MKWKRLERATLDDVVELLRGIGTILMEIDEKLAAIVRETETTRMKKRKRDPDELRELLERGAAARRNMQEIIDRVGARMQERQARRERSLLRRIFAR